jgi:2-polyprenyl-6-hydroxyphenyl methylase/3-demethylubiquinone-9 3-methyltransferase
MNPEIAQSSFAQEVGTGQRFEFGRNWARFLDRLNDERIAQAQRSLVNWLQTGNLLGKSFLDIGCGSGLFSLAARKLGAKVHTFDYDPQSVECARALRTRYFANGHDAWTIEAGNVLDRRYMEQFREFEVVYAWGVLHHTGDMWRALEHAALPVAPRGGRLHLAIYNDQGPTSQRWRRIKKLYNSSRAGRTGAMAAIIPYWVFRGLLSDLKRLKNPLTRYREYGSERGMSRLTDWLDWLGGYPFEVAKPEHILEFYLQRGFRLQRLRTAGGGLGNNEYLLVHE